MIVFERRLMSSEQQEVRTRSAAALMSVKENSTEQLSFWSVLKCWRSNASGGADILNQLIICDGYHGDTFIKANHNRRNTSCS